MEIVSFEIAKKLKEKGFREKVNAYYGKHENIFDVHPALDMNDADYRASAPHHLPSLEVAERGEQDILRTCNSSRR